MADAADSKSAAPCGRVGSTPISGTKGLDGRSPLPGWAGPRGYSYRRASIGSSRDALAAG